MKYILFLLILFVSCAPPYLYTTDVVITDYYPSGRGMVIVTGRGNFYAPHKRYNLQKGQRYSIHYRENKQIMDIMQDSKTVDKRKLWQEKH